MSFGLLLKKAEGSLGLRKFWDTPGNKFRENPNAFKKITGQVYPDSKGKALSDMYDAGVGNMSRLDRADSMRTIGKKHGLGVRNIEDMVKSTPGKYTLRSARQSHADYLSGKGKKTTPLGSNTWGKGRPYPKAYDDMIKKTQSIVRSKSSNPMTMRASKLGGKTIYPGSAVAPALGYGIGTALNRFGQDADKSKSMGVQTQDLPFMNRTEKNLREKGGILGSLASIPFSVGAGMQSILSGKPDGYAPGYANQQARLQKDRDMGNQPKAKNLVNPNSKIADYDDFSPIDSTGAKPGTPNLKAQNFINKNKTQDMSKLKIPSWMKYKPLGQ